MRSESRSWWLCLGVCVVFSLGLSSAVESQSYLIVTPDSLYDGAVALEEYRRSTGHSPVTIKLSDIGPTAGASTIDAYIASYVNSHATVRYVALIGDMSLFPAWTVPDYPTPGDTLYSDLEYAVMGPTSDDHYLPHISVGRIPGKISQEIIDYVNKIHRFESYSDPRNSVLFFGHYPELNYADDGDAAVAAGFNYDTSTLADPTVQELFIALNSPSTLMSFYYGHGSCGGNAPLYLYNLDSLTNSGHPFIYFSGACNFNDYTCSDFLGKALVLHEGGAVASIGAQIDGGYGYYYKFVDMALETSICACTAGEMYREALERYWNLVAEAGQDVSIGSWTYYFIHRLTYLGDPAVKLQPGDCGCGGPCCEASAGNVNADFLDAVDVGDLTLLVNYLFVTFDQLYCPAEANTSGDVDCDVDVSDLTALVNHLFVTFEPLARCDPACE